MLTLLVVWLLGIGALLALVLAVLHGWQPERLRTGLEWAAPRLIDHELRIERIEGTPLDGLTLHGIRIWPVGEDPATSGTLRALRASVRVDGRASLRRRALVLSDVTLVQPTIDVSRHDERGWVLVGWGALRSGPPDDGDDAAGRRLLPFAILVGSLQASDVHLAISRDVGEGVDVLGGRVDLGAEGLRLAGRLQLDWPNEGFVRAQLDRARWRDRDLGTGRLLARLRGPEVRIETLDVSGSAGQAAIEGALTFAGSLDRPRLRLGDLHGRVDDLDLAPIFRRGADTTLPAVSHLSGNLDAALHGDAGDHGDDGGFMVDLHGRLDPSTVLGGRIERVEAAGAYRTRSRSWWLHEGTIDLAAGRIELSGRGEGRRAEQIEGRVRALELARIPAPWRRGWPLRGRADVDVLVMGDLADPSGTVEVRAEDLVVHGTGPGVLEVAVRGRGESRYWLDTLDWSFGPGAGSLAGIRLQTLGPASLELGRDTIAVHDLALDWTGGSMVVDGGFRAGLLLPTHAAVEELDVAVAARVLGLADDVGGILEGAVDASGALGDPDLQARLEWRQARLRGLRADRIDVSIDGDASARTLGAAITRDGREQLRIGARLPRPIPVGDPRGWLSDARTTLDLDVDSLDVAWLRPLLSLRSLEPAGRIDGRLAIAGGAAGPTARGELRLDGLRLDRAADEAGAAQPVLGPVAGVLTFSGRRARTEALRYGEAEDEFRLDAELGWSGARAESLDLSGTVTGVGFTGRAVMDVALRDDHLEPSVLTFSDFDVAELSRRARVPGRLAGKLTGELVVRGPTAAPDFRTKLAWRDARVADVRADRLTVEAHSDAQTVALYGGLERSGRAVLDVTGLLALDRRAPIGDWLEQLRRSPTHASTRLDIDADAFPLDWLPILAPRLPLKTAGIVEGHLTLRGADPVVRVDGELTLEQGVFSLATQTASVGPLAGTIQFEGQRARFDRLVLSASRGSAVLSGWAHWAAGGIDEVALRATFDGYRFDQLGLLQSTLDGSVEARGALQSLAVRGELSLGSVRIAFPSQEDPVLKEIRVMGLTENGGSASIREGRREIAGIQEQSTVDVTFRLPRGTWVRGIGLDAEIVGEVHVTKAERESLRYVGRMEVQNGRYALQGKRFELDRGVAVFTGGTSPVPEVDIEAHRKASREVTVFAHVTGPADRPKLELTSQPPMDTAEILSYLFFGRSATAGDRESRGLGVSAASVAGSVLLDSVAPELRDTLRIDEIGVTSQSDGTPAVEIETQVTPDVYLRVIQSLGASADEAVEVRWRFWKGLSVKSQVSRSGASTIDLLWEFDYWGLERFGLGGFRSPPPPYRTEPPVPIPCRPPIACPPE